MSSMSQKTEEATEQTLRVIGEHPLPSALTAFGVGLGVGLLAATLLPGVPREREAAFTQRMLDTVSRMVPESFAKRMS